MEKNIIRKLSIIFAGLAGLFAALEIFLNNGTFGEKTGRISLVIMGAAAFVFIIYYVIRGRLYKKLDAWLLFLFLLFAFIVTWAYYGFSVHLFTPRVYYLWSLFIFLYCAARVMEKPEPVVKAFSLAYVPATCVIGIYILIHATLTLREAIPGSDRILGCFRVGRLCGLGNANTMAYYCLTAIMLSIYGVVKGKKVEKIFYGIATAVLWFLMGMNDSRTMNYALAFTLAAFLFVLTLRYLAKKGTKKIVRILAAIAVSAAAALSAVLLFMVPTHIYRASVSVAAKASGDQQMLDNVELIYERNLGDVETLTDRGLVWEKSVELIFKTPRRALLGISVKSAEVVNGVYEGRHDITMPFAHTMLLEVFRRMGLIGLIIWVALLIIWCRNGIVRSFAPDQDLGLVYLMAAAAGVLLTGITELGPYVLSVAMGVPYLFFLCCGIAMRDGDNEKTDLS
jgi:hypothetical protein